MRRTVRLLLGAVMLGGILFLFAIPARTWLSQRSAMSSASRRLSELTAENKALDRQVAQLQSPSYVEQLARSQFGLVMPGQPAYEILPAASSSGSSG
ncbi:MAG: FtsB family cell division protein [Acidimicrobiales bacterium]